VDMAFFPGFSQRVDRAFFPDFFAALKLIPILKNGEFD
jgi:hypothetical protein